jgi:hypothetical protein
MTVEVVSQQPPAIVQRLCIEIVLRPSTIAAWKAYVESVRHAGFFEDIVIFSVACLSKDKHQTRVDDLDFLFQQIPVSGVDLLS